MLKACKRDPVQNRQRKIWPGGMKVLKKDLSIHWLRYAKGKANQNVKNLAKYNIYLFIYFLVYVLIKCKVHSSAKTTVFRYTILIMLFRLLTVKLQSYYVQFCFKFLEHFLGVSNLIFFYNMQYKYEI